MLSSRKPFVGARAMALVVALVGAVCLVVAAMASVSSSGSAEAEPRTAAADNNPLKYVTEDSPPNPSLGGTYKAVAKCPSDHQVISGGFDVHFLDTPWAILGSRPVTSQEAGGRAWAVEALLSHRAGKNIRPFTAYAVCAPQRLVPPVSIHYPSRTVEVGASEKRELTPDCRGSYKAIGGGFGLGNTFFHLIRSQPNPGNGFRSWIVKALNYPGGSATRRGDLSAYSVCVREESVKNLKFLDRAQTGTNFVQVGTERCQQGTYLLAGGGGTAEGDARYIEWSHIRPGGGSQADPPKDWAAGAQGDWFSVTIHAHAMCGELVGPKAGGQK